jgi:hypothetical protein
VKRGHSRATPRGLRLRSTEQTGNLAQLGAGGANCSRYVFHSLTSLAGWDR